MEKNKVENYTEEQRAEINEITERQYRKMLAEGKYKDLLIKFGQNGNYSVSNMLYLLSQNPDITVVKGMNEWERAGRHIKEGAKSMEIMAPTKVKYNVKVTNPDGSPKFDEDGEQIVREKERAEGFHPNYVFDISDTKGAEYVPYKIDKVSDAEKRVILDGVFNALSGRRYKYKFTNESKFAEGETYQIDKEERTVRLRKGMNNTTTVLTAIEAASRALSDNFKGKEFEGMTGENAEKVESASRSCILAAHFGLDTSGYNFDFMKNMTEEQAGMFRENLSCICSGTKLVMDKIARSFYRDQQARADAAPAVADDNFGWDPFRPASEHDSEMECA